MDKYVIGIDFGSTGGQLVLVNIKTGEEVCSCRIPYKHKNMENVFPDMKENEVVQHPKDYLDVLYEGIPQLIKSKNVLPEQIVAIGIDTTTSTVLPTTRTGKPMCFLNEFKRNHNAYIRLWKDHSAQKEADLLNEVTLRNKENRIKLSAEWLLPKALYIFFHDRNLYDKMEKYMEVGDWLTWKLTGIEARSSMQASVTYLWDVESGYLYQDSLKELDDELENFYKDKLSSNIVSPTQAVGTLCAEMAEKLGLTENVAVAAANIDAIATVPALGEIESGKILSTLGTSSCHIVFSEKHGAIEDTLKAKLCISDDLNTYISSQIAVGDVFDWYINSFLPNYYYMEAEKRHESIFAFMDLLASKVDPVKFELIALDWFNGLRTNSNCRGVIAGLSINTKPEEVYLALLESTAFGLRYIIDDYEKNGIPIKEIRAAGGVAHKNSIILQRYADITKRPIRKSKTVNATAVGAAIFAAVAAGFQNGGYHNLKEATRKMLKLDDKVYLPRKEYETIYDKRYNEYKSIRVNFFK